MAAGIMGNPGSEFGPCIDPCNHRDCEASRTQAASIWAYCGRPIGYGVRYYADEPGGWCHAVCLEVEYERSKLDCG